MYINILERGDGDEVAPLHGSRWWRWSDYKLVGGTHIAPAPGAKLEVYEPLSDHGEYWGGRKRKGEFLPYAELSGLTATDPDAVLQWYSRYGALGILLHRTLEAHLWPRWKRIEGSDKGDKKPEFLPFQGKYRRGAPGWLDPGELFGPRSGFEERPLRMEEIEEYVVHTEKLFEATRRPTVIVERWQDGAPQELSITEGYGQFFPDVDGVTDWVAWKTENFRLRTPGPPSDLADEDAQELEEHLDRERYPLPGSEDFLRRYAEPLYLFNVYAREVKRAVGFWDDARFSRTRDDLAEVAQRFAPISSGDFPDSMNAALRTIHPTAEFVGRPKERLHWELRWQFPSLYAAMHSMILQDFPRRGAIAKKCQRCSRTFVTDNDRQKYCTNRCQRTAQTARYREGLKNDSDEG